MHTAMKRGGDPVDLTENSASLLEERDRKELIFVVNDIKFS